MSRFKFIHNIKVLEFLIALLFIFGGVAARLLPHPFNFTPIAAIALFGGTYFSKKIALALPILAMFISDIFLGFYQPLLMFFVYGSFLLCIILGFWIKRHKKWYLVFINGFLAAFIFFFLTNFAVWAFTPWYAKTLSGLIQCYLMALPFFRNTLLGNFFYVTVFFGSYEIGMAFINKRLKQVLAATI